MNAPAPIKHRGPTAERLREVLDYDAATGKFIWIKPPWNHADLVGRRAGCQKSGYEMIKVDGVPYKAHRLAWLYVHGAMSARRIDHRDGNPLNNAIENLREATQGQNGANAKRRAGKTLPKGVRLNGSGYTARISFQRRLKTIGTFPTIEQAAAAYLAEAQRLYGEFARAA